MGRLTRSPLALVAVAGLLFGLAPVAAAADPVVFGTPSAVSKYGTGIDFAQPVTVSGSIGRAELLLTVADSIGPTVIEQPDPPAAGASTLRYTFDTSGSSHLIPNTPIVARWRLFAADDPNRALLGPEVRLVYADDSVSWKTTTGDLVHVHWVEGDAAFGAKALKIAEDAVRETSKLLGVTESEPIDFYIYADGDAFREALGPATRENVGGQANAGIRTLFALVQPNEIDSSWVDVVITHELTHLVFDTAVHNPYHFPPRWLNEGLAVYNSQGYDTSDRGQVEDGAKDGTLIPLDGLTGQFPTTGDRFGLAYAESVSAVDYLVRTYTGDVLVQLIRSYADGRTDDEAFTAALGVDMTDFGAAWMADLHAKAPTLFGPQPAAPGPVPVAWSGGAGAVSPPPAAPSGQGAPTAAASGIPAAPAGTTAGDAVWWVGPALLIAAIVLIVGLVVATQRRRAADERA